MDVSHDSANPEDSEMLHDMAAAVKHGADVALGFDGDGDRCGVVDDEGEEIFADKSDRLVTLRRADKSRNSANCWAVRTVLRLIDGMFTYAVAFVVALASDKRQRLGQTAAHTLVVRK